MAKNFDSFAGIKKFGGFIKSPMLARGFRNGEIFVPVTARTNLVRNYPSAPGNFTPVSDSYTNGYYSNTNFANTVTLLQRSRIGNQYAIVRVLMQFNNPVVIAGNAEYILYVMRNNSGSPLVPFYAASMKVDIYLGAGVSLPVVINPGFDYIQSSLAFVGTLDLSIPDVKQSNFSSLSLGTLAPGTYLLGFMIHSDTTFVQNLASVPSFPAGTYGSFINNTNDFYSLLLDTDATPEHKETWTFQGRIKVKG